MAELNTNETETTVETTETQAPKTYTQEEVDALLQRESDRRVTSALKKQQEKLKEAEKVSRMNDAEKYEYELQQREKAIEAKEKELALAENKNVCSKILAEKGLSLDLVDFIVAEDADTMNDNIKRLDKAFKASVKAEVEKRLGSNSPKKNLADEGTVTKESFRKMSLVEQQKFANENPVLYQQLTR